MEPAPHTPRRRIAGRVSSKILDEVRFFRSWVESPLKTGAVSPSGPALAAMMARHAEPDRDGPIVELGPGTGVVTAALAKRGIPLRRLVLVEFNPAFCNLLKKRFPGATVIEGDAYALGDTLKSALGDRAERPLASIVSSLPLFSRPPAARREMVDIGLKLLAPGAPFVQFSYALVPPVAPQSGRFDVDKSSWIVNNFPPARVWIYRRSEDPAT